MTALERLASAGHEELVVVRDRESGLLAVIAIHDSRLGPAVGGTRMKTYADLDAAVEDALRLSSAMTKKAALAGIRRGGAKAVIVGDPAKDKSVERLLAYGRAVERLAGRFFTAGDMGIGAEELAVIGRVTRHVSRLGPDSPVDPSTMAGLGVYHSVAAAARFLGLGLNGLHVAVQGIGKIGYVLAERLARDGARLTVADVVPGNVERAVKHLGAASVGPEEIASVACDVFSPNAASGVLDRDTIARLRCPAVVGGANEQLGDPGAADALLGRGILWAPDYVASAGGLLCLPFELGEEDAAGTHEAVRRIGDRLIEIWTRASRENVSPARVAERMVEDVLARAARH